MKPRLLLLAAATVLGVSGGALYSWHLQSGEAPAPVNVAVTELVGQPRPPFTLGDTEGQRISADGFDGDVLLINFWATWCTPCREEMPMLVEIQGRYGEQGLSVVGIALDDVQQARDFAAELGVTYTVLVGGADVMAVGAVYGNRSGMLPYTVLVDRRGIVRWTHLGILEQEQIVEQVKALL